MQAKTLLLMAMSGGIGAFLMVSFVAVSWKSGSSITPTRPT